MLYIYVCATPNSRTVSEPPVSTGGAHSCARTGNRRRRINLLLSHLMHAPPPGRTPSSWIGQMLPCSQSCCPDAGHFSPPEPRQKGAGCCYVLRHSCLGHSISTAFGQSACGSVCGASYPLVCWLVEVSHSQVAYYGPSTRLRGACGAIDRQN